MDFATIFQSITGMGEAGVGIAQLITSIFPASWWASGILNLIRMFLSALSGVITG
ncbi:MAG: hypothetical protein IJJ61_00480 [Clostridia bacterium]|nr:hypothetical protein [Clostridia bacterium]